MTASAAEAMAWEIRSDLPGRLRLSLEDLRHSPALRRHCDTVLAACHWLHGFRLNRLAGSLSVRFPEARRTEVIDLLTQALAPPTSDAGADLLNPAPGSVLPRRQQPLLLRHGSLCAVALALDLWLGLPALLINGAAALLTLPLLAHAWKELRQRPPRLTEVLDVGLSALLLRQGLGREALVDQVLEDGSTMLQGLEDEASREPPLSDVLRRLGDLARVRPDDRLLLAPGSRVWLALELVEGRLGVIRPAGAGLWNPRAIEPGQLLEPGWLVVAGQGVGRVRSTLADEERFHLPPALTPPPTPTSLPQRLLHLQDQLLDPLLLALGGALALAGATERAMATFQFNPLSDWRASEVALRLATRADMGLHGIQIAHPRVLVDLARVDHLLISPDCLTRLDRLVPRERLMEASGLQPGDLLRLVANLRHHLLQPTRDPSWRTLPLEGWPAPLGADTPDPWRPVDVTCAAGGGGWQVALEDGRQLMVLQADTDADAVEDADEDEDENTNPPGATTLEVRDREGILGTITLERHVDPAWGEVCDHLRQMGITVVPLEAPESAADDVAWRLEAVLALQRQGRVVAWLGDELADIPAMTRAEVAIGLPSAQGHLLPSSLLDLTVGQDPRWLPRLVALSRDLAGASRANLWLIGLTHVLSSLASAGLAVTPLQMVVLADLPLLLAELNNRRASARKMGRTPAFSLRSWAPL